MALDNIPATKVFRQRDVRETPIRNLTEAEAVPVGAIIPWLKSYTNTPALPMGYVECKGQTLDDSDSVYDGEVIPDLNGDNQFVRGNSTSGGTGGVSTNNLAHTHDISGTTGSHTLTISQIPEHSHYFYPGGAQVQIHTITAGSYGYDSGSYNVAGMYSGGGVVGSTGGGHTHSFSDTSDSKLSATTDNKPPYYNVVWIMRVK